MLFLRIKVLIGLLGIFFMDFSSKKRVREIIKIDFLASLGCFENKLATIAIKLEDARRRRVSISNSYRFR